MTAKVARALGDCTVIGTLQCHMGVLASLIAVLHVQEVFVGVDRVSGGGSYGNGGRAVPQMTA